MVLLYVNAYFGTFWGNLPPQSLHDSSESLRFMKILTVIQSAGTKVAPTPTKKKIGPLGGCLRTSAADINWSISDGWLAKENYYASNSPTTSRTKFSNLYDRLCC
jgi:hypothetical protein